jgi:hypothetical protein
MAVPLNQWLVKGGLVIQHGFGRSKITSSSSGWVVTNIAGFRVSSCSSCISWMVFGQVKELSTKYTKIKTKAAATTIFLFYFARGSTKVTLLLVDKYFQHFVGKISR